jgi:hypothetical protein
MTSGGHCTADAQAPTPRPSDAGYDAGQDPPGLACFAMSKLGCPEAWPDAGSCHDLVSKFSADPVTGIHADCILNAHDLAAMRACHVRCLK